MRVAAVQHAPRGDAASGAAAQFDHVRAAAADGARLIVVPEGALSGLAVRQDQARAAAQRLDGPYVEGLRALTDELGVAVVGHLYEPGASGSRPLVFSTAVVVDRGELAATYRKIHLFDAQGFAESTVVEAGGAEQVDTVLATVGGEVLGVAICFDVRFGELAVLYARRGASVLAVPAAWVAGVGKREQWDVLVRARAIESGCAIVAAAQPGPSFCGGSVVIGPEGDVLAGPMPADEEGFVAADLDPAASARARSATPTLRHRPVWGAR